MPDSNSPTKPTLKKGGEKQVIIAIEELDKQKTRMAGGEFGGKGSWDIYRCSLKGKENTASFKLGINLADSQIDVQPLHPNDARMLTEAFGQVFSYKGNRN